MNADNHLSLKRGAIISVGGPALTYWVVPTEEELRSRYNPELLKRSLEGREERQQEFDDFVMKLKEYSKSDKPSWSPIISSFWAKIRG